jgi:hypothetical protein
MAENLDELRERAELLSIISKMEDDAEWTDLDELRERAALDDNSDGGGIMANWFAAERLTCRCPAQRLTTTRCFA